eukprot:UN27027
MRDITEYKMFTNNPLIITARNQFCSIFTYTLQNIIKYIKQDRNYDEDEKKKLTEMYSLEKELVELFYNWSAQGLKYLQVLDKKETKIPLYCSESRLVFCIILLL